jgi:hypothetical protein
LAAMGRYAALWDAQQQSTTVRGISAVAVGARGREPA